MNVADAEEYTQALGQIGAGWWRQIALGQRLGVPQALGMTVEEWVTQRLGGYVRLSVPERRAAVSELIGPAEHGGQDLSHREAAAILGVSPMTVHRDARSVSNGTAEEDRPESRAGSGVPDDTSVSCESCGTPALPLWLDPTDEFTGRVLCGRCAEREAEVVAVVPIDGWRAWQAFLDLSGLREFVVSDLVDALPSDRLEHVEPVATALLEWLPRVVAYARERQAEQPVALGKERILRGKDELWLEGRDG